MFILIDAVDFVKSKLRITFLVIARFTLYKNLRYGTLKNQVKGLIIPQAIFSTALPEGCVVKSSGLL